jgi:hypothetical protein
VLEVLAPMAHRSAPARSALVGPFSAVLLINIYLPKVYTHTVHAQFVVSRSTGLVSDTFMHRLHLPRLLRPSSTFSLNIATLRSRTAFLPMPSVTNIDSPSDNCRQDKVSKDVGLARLM